MTVAPRIEVRSLRNRDPLSDRALYRELGRRFFVWDAFVGGERRVDLHPLVLPDELHRAAVEAAEEVTRVVGAVAARAHRDPGERARYGLHAEIEALTRASYEAGDDALLARVDLLLGEDGRFSACEINADCPGGHNEALGLPELSRSAGFLEGANPTRVVEGLAARLCELAAGRGAVALLHATAYAEDLQVCALIQRAVEKRGVRAILASPTAPRLEGGELRIADARIAVLYRFFPAEYMEGQKNLPGITAALRSGAVRSLSSFAHIYAQSKLAFARAWALEGELAPADAAAVRAYLPPSFDVVDVPRDELVRDRVRWVVKRALGRVGDQVFVGPLCHDGEWAALVDEVLGLRARGEPWIVQRFVPQRPIPTPWGERFVTLGAYVLGGRFAGYFARVTPETHVSHGALCVPVFTEGTRSSASPRGGA